MYSVCIGYPVGCAEVNCPKGTFSCGVAAIHLAPLYGKDIPVK